MIDWIRDELQNNDFLVGVIGAGLLTWGGWTLRKIPSIIYQWVKIKFGFSIDTQSYSGMFLPALTFFEDTGIFKSRHRYRIYGSQKILPSNGVYFKWLYRRPCMLHLRSDKNDNGGEEYSLHFYCFAANKKIRETILKQISLKLTDKTSLYMNIWSSGYWKQKSQPKRTMQSIFLSNDEKEKLLKDIKGFHDLHDHYLRTGIPFKRGYLFYGPPGTGKSSTAIALANELKRSIYIINLGDFVADVGFKEAWQEIEPGSIVLFEDIDVQSSADDKKSVSTSCLLNCLDGAMALNDCITIFTTNNVDSLNEALIRQGRIDRKIYMGDIDRQTAKDMVEFILGDKADYINLEGQETFSPVKLQEECLLKLNENGYS